MEELACVTHTDSAPVTAEEGSVNKGTAATEIKKTSREFPGGIFFLIVSLMAVSLC